MELFWQVYQSAVYEVKTAVWTCGSTTTATVVSAVTAKKIRVLYFTTSATAATTYNFRSNTTDISGNLAAGTTQTTAALAPLWFQTVAGEPLTVNNASATTVRGIVGYIEIP